MAETVLITGARAPVAMHMARLFKTAGWKVIMADTLRHPLAVFDSACDGYERLPAPLAGFDRFAQALSGVLRRHAPALVVPTCEEVFHLARCRREHEPSMPLFAPPLEVLLEAHSKAAFMRRSASAGLHVPQTWLLENRSDMARIAFGNSNLVFKPVWSRFASQVLIKPDARQLQALAPTPQRPWVAQQFIEGREICIYAAAVGGRVTALSAYHPAWRAGRGAGILFEPVSDSRARALVEAYAAATAWTGQISFDAILSADGRLFPLECNPRATSGLHFFRQAQAFVDAFRGGAAIEPDCRSALAVKSAMRVYGLPQALRTGRLKAYRAAMAGAGDALAMPGFRAPKWGQSASVLELAALALRKRISLLEASTDGIEWNGPDGSGL